MTLPESTVAKQYTWPTCASLLDSCYFSFILSPCVFNSRLFWVPPKLSVSPITGEQNPTAQLSTDNKKAHLTPAGAFPSHRIGLCSLTSCSPYPQGSLH